MNRRQFAAAFPPALALACSKPSPPSRLRVVVTSRTSNVGFYAALEYGYFREAGLDIEMLPENTRMAAALPLVGTGKIDIIFGPISPASINAVAKGVRLRIVAGRRVQVAGCGDLAVMYARKDSFPNRLKDLNELRGKRLECSGRATSSEFMLDALLEAAGLRPDDVHILIIRREEAFAALLNGGLDVLLDDESDNRLTDVTDVVFVGPSLVSILPNFQNAFVYFGSRLLDTNPELGTRFLTAYVRGVRAYLGGANPKWLSEYADRFHLDKSQLLNQCRDFLTPDANYDLPSIQKFLTWSIRKGYSSAPDKADALVDGAFLDGAWKQLGRKS